MIKPSQPTQSSVHIIISIVVSGYKSDTGWGADETTPAHVNTRDTVRAGAAEEDISTQAVSEQVEV